MVQAVIKIDSIDIIFSKDAQFVSLALILLELLVISGIDV